MSSQNSFLPSRLFRLFTKKCRRADIFDFSPYISHFFTNPYAPASDPSATLRASSGHTQPKRARQASPLQKIRNTDHGTRVTCERLALSVAEGSLATCRWALYSLAANRGRTSE